jgi:hypothetical protein
MTIDEWNGATLDLGQVVGTARVPPGPMKKVWLTAKLDARPNGTRAADFFYSFDGRRFSKLGGTYELYTNWPFFLGYRFGIFNYATEALGGSVKVKSFINA